MSTALASCVAFSVAVAQQARQDQSPRMGTHMAYHFDVRDPGVGAQLDVPVAPRFALYPSGAVYLVDTGSLWGVNADVKYNVARPVYLGGGLNILRRDIGDAGNTDAGVNLLAGVEGHLGPRIHPSRRVVILNEGAPS
jgi:hypothetical protein